MPVLTESESVVKTVRLPPDINERVLDYATEAGLTISGALRVLIELGLRGVDNGAVDLANLSAIQFNANAEALSRLDKLLVELLARYQYR
ncbi:MAG: hypothetical protein ACYTBJ_00410 [Planctomycetota bacterium]|jgi:hypothetical protein